MPGPPPRRLISPAKICVVTSPIFLGPMMENAALPTPSSATAIRLQRQRPISRKRRRIVPEKSFARSPAPMPCGPPMALRGRLFRSMRQFLL